MNWKARIRNKYFWTAVISTIFLTARLFGYQLPAELESKVGQAFDAVAGILTLLGVFINPTTEGLMDND